MAGKGRRDPVDRTAVVYSAAISLDGFIADLDGGVDWLHAAMVPGEGYGLREFMASVDAVLMGSRTYEKSLTLGGGPRMASTTPCWVFSSRRLEPVKGMTITGADPAAVVAELPARGIRRAWLMGGGRLASSFLAAGLIDEIVLGVMPVVLGRGLPLFGGAVPASTLELVESKIFKGGALGLTYRCQR
jgi:dihydrofolate reductase